MSDRPAVRFARLDDPDAREAYADLCASSPQRTAFAGLAFADAACEAFGLTGRVALLGGDGRADVGAVLFEKRTGPFRQVVVPPLTPYTGPLLRDAVGLTSAEPLGAFLRAVAARYDAVAFQPPPAVADVRPFQWAGFDAAPRYTYWGPSGPDAAPPYVRKMVRENGPVRVDGSVRAGGTATLWDPSGAPDVVAAMGRAFVRIGERVPVAPARAERLVRAAVEAGVARIVVAETRGERVGAVASVFDDATGHFWAGAGDPGPSMLLMMAATSEMLAAAGVPAIDLVGGNIARVSTFKRRFGLPLGVYYRVTHVRSRALRLRAALRLP